MASENKKRKAKTLICIMVRIKKMENSRERCILPKDKGKRIMLLTRQIEI